MDTDTFWEVMETARIAVAGGDEPFDEALVSQLADRPEQEILEYAQRFEKAHDALYRWDVWAAVCLIGGGCSDDGFIDFRAGVIALGREWYEHVAADPDSLAAHPVVARGGAIAGDCSDVLNYAASVAFERATGDADAFHEAQARFVDSGAYQPDEEADLGEAFDFDDDKHMSRRLPRLAAMFLGTRR